jgi:integrase
MATASRTTVLGKSFGGSPSACRRAFTSWLTGRNTGLTNWRRAGVDIATIAKLAGHTDIAHTEHYLGNITPEEIARVPDAFSQIYGKQAV